MQLHAFRICRRAGSLACPDRRQQRVDLCARRLAHRHTSCVDLRRHLHVLCVAGRRSQDQRRLQPRGSGAAGGNQRISLREFGFFTFTKADGKKVAFEDPVDYYLEYRDAALTLHFTLPFKTPVKARELAVEVFDPAGFNDFRFADQDPVRLVGAPPACRVSLQRARQDADAEEPDEQAVENDRSPGRGTGLANRIAVNCP